MKSDNLCGVSCYHPGWLQKFANTKSFLIVYGLLGTIQAMSYLYFVVTLTTIEKRFKIPSKTTGIILSGNEISQILLSLILSYAGGQRNRPRWIAWGVVFCSLSCFILAMPHFIYGAGEDALQLTKEYATSRNEEAIKEIYKNSSLLISKNVKDKNRLCLSDKNVEICDELFSFVPLILIFLSQFVLGIGNTLYYSLGQSYLDDNTKKKNTPIMLAYAMSLRMLGPVVGFALGYFSLNIYIDPTKTPLIDKNDPRWLGAWWLGWILLGFVMLIFAILIGLFPKELPNMKFSRQGSHTPKALLSDGSSNNFGRRALRQQSEGPQVDHEMFGSIVEFPLLKHFPTALMRLLKNKLLMYNILSGIFYILGSSGYITFLAKYLEVQFHKNAAEATVVTGPVMLIGMVSGLLASGYIITKKKPGPRLLLFWNVVVGISYVFGQFSFMFLTCPDHKMPLEQGRLNLSLECNEKCACDDVPYTPICNIANGQTYFSPCHAGCNLYNEKEKYYSQCNCLMDSSFWKENTTTVISTIETTTTTTTISDTTWPYLNLSSYPSEVTISSTLPPFPTLNTTSSIIINSTLSTNSLESVNRNVNDEMDYVIDYDDIKTTPTIINPEGFNDEYHYEDEDNDVDITDNMTLTRKKRLSERQEQATSTNIPLNEEYNSLLMYPGPCLEGCALGFMLFTSISTVINFLGATGRIGNLLVNYRAVSKQDKSFTQGLVLMMISLFALIPGPILYGWIIDQTCLVWNTKCGKRGNCQLYDQRSFRVNINTTAMCLTSIGVFFDILVCYYGKNLDLYGEADKIKLQKYHTPRPTMPMNKYYAANNATDDDDEEDFTETTHMQQRSFK